MPYPTPESELRALAELAVRLSTPLDPDLVLKEGLVAFREIVRAGRAALFHYAPGQGPSLLYRINLPDVPAARLPISHSALHRTRLNGRPLVSQPAAIDATASQRLNEIQTVAVLPLPIDEVELVLYADTIFDEVGDLPSEAFMTSLGILMAHAVRLARANQQREQDRWARSRLAHDLQGPVTVLQATLSATRPHLAADLQDELEASVARFRTMVESLIRPAACSETNLFDLVLVAVRSINSLQRAAHQQDRALSLDGPPDLLVLQQEEAVASILNNLLLNAIIHGRPGRVQASIRAHEGPPPERPGSAKVAPPPSWHEPWALEPQGRRWVELEVQNPAPGPLLPEHFQGWAANGRARLGLVTITGMAQALGGRTTCAYTAGNVVLNVAFPREAVVRRRSPVR